MSKKMILSLFLIIVGVITGLLTVFAYGMSGGNTAITMVLLFIAIICIMIGSILAFTRLLDRILNPVLEEIHKDIEDDLQDIKERRFTNTHWMVLIVSTALIAFSFFVFRFHKVEAAWGPVPVMIPTSIGMLALAWFIPRTGWFRISHDHTPMWIFFIPTIGLIISLWLGLVKTENINILRSDPVETVSYNTMQPTGFIYQGVGDVADIGLSLALPDCDDEVCGAILLAFVLIVLTFVLVIGSAFIPHFWILSCSILLGIMMLIAMHDLRIRPIPKDSLITGQ